MTISRWIGMVLAIHLSAIVAVGQGPASMSEIRPPGATISDDELASRVYGMQAHKTVAAIVYNPHGEPISGARVEITNNAGAVPRYLITDHQGQFQAEFQLLEEQAGGNFIASIKITKRGYQAAHKVTPFGGSTNNLAMAITLRPIEPEDPEQLSQADLISAAAPHLRSLGPADHLSPKQQKDYARGVEEFLDRHRLAEAVPRLLNVAALNPNCLRCRTMLALAELSWADWDDPRSGLQEAVNSLLKDKALACPEPLFVSGVLEEWDRDADRAVSYFAEALKYAPNDPIILQELGRAQSMRMNWWAANETLGKAVAAGAGPEARLMHARALAWVGNSEQARAEMNAYLAGRNVKDMPLRVRNIYEQIESGTKEEAVVAAWKAKARMKAHPVELPDYFHHPPPLENLQPAANQDGLPQILAATGANVVQLFQGLPNICSTEKVNQEKLSRDGKTEGARQYTYRYLLTVPDQKLGPGVDEFRADLKGHLDPQPALEEAFMLTTGFVSAPMIFYPSYQSGSSFRLLGTQQVKARTAYVVAYAQNPEKSPLSGTFQWDGTVRHTFKQGIAWIDAESYQIVRMESDLLEPLPVLRLTRETTDIVFNEFHFKAVSHNFWLPQAVTVTLDWNGRAFRNTHSYSDFLLSNVESTQKISQPKETMKPAGFVEGVK